MLQPGVLAWIEERLDLPRLRIACCDVTAFKTITEIPHRLPLKLSAVDLQRRLHSYPSRRCRSSPTGITPIIARDKECSHAPTSARDSPPPPPAAPTPQITPHEIWATLPAEHRRQTLQTRSRLVVQQLHHPRSPQEVSHEDG